MSIQPYIIEDENCRLEVRDNPNGESWKSNHPYTAKLIDGDWPDDVFLSL